MIHSIDQETADPKSREKVSHTDKSLLLRDMEINPRDKTILAYDATEPRVRFELDREHDESDEKYEARSAALRMLFP